MLEDIPHQCPILEDLIIDVLVGQAPKGLPLLHFTLWLLRDMCCTDKGFLLKYLKQKSTSSVGRNVPVGVLERVY